MRSWLSAAGRSFLRAFAAALIVLAPGILSAPTIRGAELLAVAALGAAIAAGIRAIQAYIPSLTVAKYLGNSVGVYVDSALRAFVGSLCVTLPGVFMAHSLNTGTALATAAIIGAVTAGFRALQGVMTSGESPWPQHGLAEPPNAHEPITPPAA